MDLKAPLVALLSFLLLAGCSSAPPSGELTEAANGLVAMGTATFTYVAEEKPIDDLAGPTGQDPPVDCVPPQTPPEADPAVGDYRCVLPSTKIVVMLHQAPDASLSGASSYEFVLAGGTEAARSIGTAIKDAANMYALNFSVAEDLTNKYPQLQVKVGDFVLATAPTASGAQQFALAEGVTGVDVAGSFKGKELTATVTGLPGNGTYTGFLYHPAEVEGGAPVRSDESFAVTNGANLLTAAENLNKYVEFHIHVTGSAINLYKGTIA